jgi:5-formyltetrahydrofolate cyclo-ligase
MPTPNWDRQTLLAGLAAATVVENPASLPVDKRGWRAAADAVARARSPMQRKQHAQALGQAVLRLVQASGARTVGLYSPIGAETETRELANSLLVHGIALAYPRLRSEGPLMDFATTTGPAALQQRPRSRLLEPAGPVIAPEDLDLVVIPCLAVSPALVRLGHGGGYFDRWLPGLPATALRLGVVPAACVWPWQPIEGHDQAMDLLCTEQGLCRPAS